MSDHTVSDLTPGSLFTATIQAFVDYTGFARRFVNPLVVEEVLVPMTPWKTNELVTDSETSATFFLIHPTYELDSLSRRFKSFEGLKFSP